MPDRRAAVQAAADDEVTPHLGTQPVASSDESAAEHESVMKASRQSSQMRSRPDVVCSRSATTKGPQDGVRGRACECHWQAGCRRNGGERQATGLTIRARQAKRQVHGKRRRNTPCAAPPKRSADRKVAPQKSPQQASKIRHREHHR